MSIYSDTDIGTALRDVSSAAGGTEEGAAGISDELRRMRGEMRDTTREAKGLATAISGSLRGAFDRLMSGGGDASDMLQRLGTDLAGRTFDAALAPVHGAVTQGLTGAIGTGISGLFSGFTAFAKGGAFSGGRTRAFAGGGVVEGPTLFPMRGGTGLMGEAGPEAILPLQRGADGRLGVASGGGRAVNVTVNIHTSDIAGFQKSQSQVAAQLARAVRMGQRNG